MSIDVPIVTAGQDEFVEIPASVKLAILLPTARCTQMAQSIIGALVGVASEEVAVLIADNSENAGKREFLKNIRKTNPNVFAVMHMENIGGQNNFFYLHDWCKKIEFSAIMADDDWMSPTYHLDAYRILLDNPHASGVAAGTTFVDIGDGKLVDVSQPSMCGDTPLERMSQWNCYVARATMYNSSRRSVVDAAIQFLKTTPLNGLTLAEDLWELNRLAMGDFLNVPGHGCFVHYPSLGSHLGDGTHRAYEALCKGQGLKYPFVFFTGLSTAIQCALFLMGNMSPIANPEQRAICGQHVFKHIFTGSFLPKVSGESSHAAAASLFANHPEAMAGFSKYCTPLFSEQLCFDQALVDWFIAVIKVFETKPVGDEIALSERFRDFVDSILC